jgi:hypothetical protein
MEITKIMKPSALSRVFLTALAAVALAGIARADLVSFSTLGSFNGGANTVMFGAGADTLTITYTGVNTANLDDNPFTFTSLGQFQTTITGAGATITPGTTFDLQLTQTTPTSGVDHFLGTLDGTLALDQSSGLVTFSTTSISIGGTTYNLSNNPLPLVPPATNNGITTVQAQLTPAAIPEPSAVALLLVSVPALLYRVRRFTHA